MIVNAIGGPTLVTKGNYIHQMYAAGYLGTIELVKRKQKTVTWSELDFFEDLKVVFIYLFDFFIMVCSQVAQAIFVTLTYYI